MAHRKACGLPCRGNATRLLRSTGVRGMRWRMECVVARSVGEAATGHELRLDPSPIPTVYGINRSWYDEAGAPGLHVLCYTYVCFLDDR
jgi:hypothetical protein